MIHTQKYNRTHSGEREKDALFTEPTREIKHHDPRYRGNNLRKTGATKKERERMQENATKNITSELQHDCCVRF